MLFVKNAEEVQRTKHRLLIIEDFIRANESFAIQEKEYNPMDTMF